MILKFFNILSYVSFGRKRLFFVKKILNLRKITLLVMLFAIEFFINHFLLIMVYFSRENILYTEKIHL